MPRQVYLQQIAVICIALTTRCTIAHAQLEQLANRVPVSANAFVVINVKSAYSSPLSRAQNWGQESLEAQRAGMIALPEEAELFLMAAEIDFEFMHPLWEIAVAHVRQMPSMQEIATRSGGRLDHFAGTDAVERPNDSFVVRLGPRVIGAMAPANRQQVARWIRDSRLRKSPELSPYLAETFKAANNPKNHVVLALELQGLLAPAEVADKLAKKYHSLLDDSANVTALSEIIAGIRGICLEVQLRSPAQARLSIDFDQDAEILAEIVKPLLMHVLAKNGAGIDDIQDWKVSPQGKSIAFEGKLSQSGLLRVFSVLSSPVGPLAASAVSGSSSEKAAAKSSQQYFQTVTNYLNDLFFSERRPSSLHQVKTWIQRYARKIEDLDNYQVDKEVIAFGRETVDSLQEIVRVLDRAEMRSDLRESNMYNFGRRRYGRYGANDYFEKSYVRRDRELIQADETGRGLVAAQEIVEQLRELSAQTRQTMTQRYDLPF